MRYFSIAIVLTMLTGCGSMNDRTVHASLFVDHLNNMPIGKTNYFMWHNSATGNQGNVKIVNSYVHKSGAKCVDYQSTVNIQDSWPMNFPGSLDRSTEFGKACQMPDGRWRIIERVM